MQYATRRESLPNPVPGRWVAEQQWPPGRLGRRWYLNASGLADDPLSGPPLPVRPGVVVGQAIQQWYGEPGDEQSHDDALSLTFDSAPLEEDVEVLGYPTVRIRVTADKPTAQLAVRVTEVTPEGKSWLVNYGIRNLTHRDSHETPTPLEPGQAYDVEFPLYLMSHRFRQGSRIRVGLSEGLWPLSWPSPEPVQLTITPGVSSISLPVRPAESEPAPMPIQDVLGTSEGAGAFIPVEPDATGRILIVSETPTYTYQAASLDTELSGSASVRSEIVAGDPTSALWQDAGSMGFKRGDWNCEVRSSYRLTADADMFHLTESVEALKDGERIFERTESHDIPRRLV